MHYDSNLFVKHLSEMVQFPTVSRLDPKDMDMQAFEGLHAYLEQAYPLVHKTFTKEVIGYAGLLYHWKGKGGTEHLPVLLAAHQDVVPEGDHGAWKYPPFAGTVADGCVWGRGSNDSKVNIQAYMDALEMLIADGFEPEYDIYMAFGYNEEIMGGPHAAAALLADVLKERGVSLGLVLDECVNTIREVDGQYVATISTSEKGYADFEISYEDGGGHSAKPGPHSALGILAQAACAIEENVFPQRLIPAIAEQFKALAPFVEPELARLFEDAEANWEELKPICAQDREYNALTRTTFAITMAQGSAQANVLPERASIIVNCRMLPGDTLDDLQKHFEDIVPAGVKVNLLKGHNAPQVSLTGTREYEKLCELVRNEYPGVRFVPAMVCGGTDLRYYCELTPTKGVYRFQGLLYNENCCNWHQVDERMDCAVLAKNVEFYVNLLQGYAN